MRIPFARLAVGLGVRAAVAEVLDSERFVLGPRVEAFERAFAARIGVRRGVGVASGTDAITLALAAVGVGPGDRVLTSAFSAGYTAIGIQRAGAVPVFADIDPQSLCLRADAVRDALRRETMRETIRAILPVHFAGHAGSDWPELLEAARGVPVVEDAAQAHGAAFRGRPLGSFGKASAFSFYPTKNLGGVGDGGLVGTDDPALAERVRRLRSGGQRARHDHAEPGWNSRLDELQAAILGVRLSELDAGNARRRELAARYREGLAGLPLRFATPGEGTQSAAHLFVIRTPERDRLRRFLAEAGVETLVHYPIPLHRQAAFAGNPWDCPEADRAAREALSLPLRPDLDDEETDAVADAIRRFFVTPGGQ